MSLFRKLLNQIEANYTLILSVDEARLENWDMINYYSRELSDSQIRQLRKYNRILHVCVYNYYNDLPNYFFTSFKKLVDKKTVKNGIIKRVKKEFI